MRHHALRRHPHRPRRNLRRGGPAAARAARPGLTVRYASNVTDVDDPLLERAAATGVDWRTLAAEQTDLFGADMAALGVIPPDVYSGVVETIPATVDAVQRMLADGSAYRVPLEPGAGGTDPGSATSTPTSAADPAASAMWRTCPTPRCSPCSPSAGGTPAGPGKRDPLDPLLWRRERPGEPHWEAGSLGTGPAGLAHRVLGHRAGRARPAFDVQGGGSDLIFPHHEMSAVPRGAPRRGGRPGSTCTPGWSGSTARR